MPPFHCTCSHCSARLGSRTRVTGTLSEMSPLRPTLYRASERDHDPAEGTGTACGIRDVADRPVPEPERESRSDRHVYAASGRVFASVGAGLLLSFIIGMAVAGSFGNKPPARTAAEQPPTPLQVTAPVSPPRRPAPPKPASSAAVPTPPRAALSAQQLLVGRWQGRRVLPELGLAIPLLVVFDQDGTFSMTFAPLPDDPAWKPYRGLRYEGVCTFRSPAVTDLEWKTPPQGIDGGIETCTIRFVDRDLVIFTNVVTGARREFRRIKG